MTEKQTRDIAAFLEFVENAPEDENIIAMDCNEHCEKLSSLAEQVANGADLEDILPELKKHMQYWGDCREEFTALVAVLKAEMNDSMPDLETDDDV